MNHRYKRIVVKIGSSSLTHQDTAAINYRKLEQLARVLTDLRSQGHDVLLVTSGAQAIGRMQLSLAAIPDEMPKKQALAAIGQAKLMMTYQRLFSEVTQVVAQVLMDKTTLTNPESRANLTNTLNQLLVMGVIPIINENDSVATHEIEFGDNDHLSAFVAMVVEADLLIILSDIDGLYQENPVNHPDSRLVREVFLVDESIMSMAGAESSSTMGTGGMLSKLQSARLVNDAGIPMFLANGSDVHILYDILEHKAKGTWFYGKEISHVE